MKEIKLPVIKTNGLKRKHLSMDEYLEFVTFNLKHTVDIKSCRKQKRSAACHMPFSIK
ncbi:MAG: hypothetical protein ISS92_06490 [Candidatus Omnitrophica bacterium]|nr:hypothetical protein [Candidatus Omnitrophota bacterium]